MRVLVTGGAGFIGSHLVDRCLALGHDVTIVDDFTSSSPDSEHLRAAEAAGVHLVQRDVSRAAWWTYFTSTNFRLIFNFACAASPPKYQLDGTKTMMTSINGIVGCLELARAVEGRVVHASTSEVYGDPTVSPQPETYRGCVNSWGPRACYDEGKRAAETLCYEASQKGADVRVARIFNTYGPRMLPDDGRVVTAFVSAALAGESMPVFGDGSQTRSLCYVDDLVNGLMKLAQLAERPASPINLGSDCETTIASLAAVVAAAAGSKLELDALPLPVDDPKQRCPDLTLARELLSWEPSVTLADGIASTIEWFRARTSARETR